MNSYIILGTIALLLSWMFFHSIYSKKYRLFVKSFLDSNNNIIVVYDKDKITMVNYMGLKFFGYSSTKAIKESHQSISDFFIEEPECYNKYTDGKDWVKKIESSESKSIKVKMFSKEDERYQYFHIKVSRMRYFNQYLLTFNNVSILEKEKKDMKKQAEYDPLTKVYNRVKLNEVFQEAIYNANRYNSSFSVILLDIDFFKAINDTYGHAVGDKVLIELARLINMSLRKTDDTFARWGGEEFMIISSHTRLDEAYRVALRLKGDVEKFSFEIGKKVTCSFGVSEFKAGDTESKLLERVDSALYEAKENGRNQVVKK